MEPLQTQMLTVTAGPAGASPLSGAAQTGWRLAAADNSWIVTLLPDQAALETTAYETWEGTFRDRLFQLIEAVANTLDPTAVQRVGLRYVDRFREEEVEAPSGWSGRIRDELLGVVIHEHLGRGVVASQQQVLFEGDGDRKVALRHGLVSGDGEEGLDYIIDVDAFEEGFRVFELENLRESIEELHTLCLAVFQQSLTEDFLTSLRGGSA
jgi:uncharacterized protein (TIGR04255 family)